MGRWRVPLGFAAGALFAFLADVYSWPRFGVGVGLGFLGLLLRASAAGYLEKGKRLAQDGPYSWFRHPLYMGSILMALGFVLAGTGVQPARSIALWTAFVLLFGWVYPRRIREEENTLEQHFGDPWRAFVARNHRFLPTFKRVPRETPDHFLWARYSKNKEYQAAIGYAAGVGLLLVKGLMFALLLMIAAPLRADVAPSTFSWRQVPNTAFGVGESIRYTIKYGFVAAGTATLEVKEIQPLAGRSAFYILSKAKTNKATDLVFKVRDKNASWMDTESLCSLQFYQQIREGLYRKETRTAYDHPTGKFTYWKKRKGKEKVQEGDVPPFVQDVLSSLYYIRTQSLEVGKDYTLEANSGGKSWPLKVTVKKVEKVRVPAGKFECLHIEPILAGDGIFQQQGKLEVWVTNDSRRIPVLLRSRVMVGAFDAEMAEYAAGTGLAEPIPDHEIDEPETVQNKP